MITPQTLLPEAIDSLPEVDAARLQFERADARLGYYLELPAFIRKRADPKGRLCDYTNDRRRAQDELDTALHNVWRMVPGVIEGDRLRVFIFAA